MIRLLIGIGILFLVPPAHAQNRDHITNQQGQRLGYTMERQNRIEAYSRTGVRLGYYDRRTNKTYDRTGRIIATGNILSSLITGSR